MQRDLQCLLDMLQSAELILTYTAQCTKDEFVANVQLQDSVIWRLLVIAEAARRVSGVQDFDTHRLLQQLGRALCWHGFGKQVSLSIFTAQLLQ